MYPRNAASPPRIAIGAVVQISDGAVQTSGCTVRILEQGGTEGDGAGTTAYSTDGIVLYTPTQAETDQAAFILIAKKTGCIPVSQTIVTSASDVAGYAGVDWSKVNAPTTTQGLSGTTISTSQAVASVSGAVGSVTGAVGSVTAVSTGAITAASFAAGAIDGNAINGGAITSAKIANNAIGGSELADDAITKIAAGIRTELTTELARIDAATSTRSTQTSVDTVAGYLDTEVGAIKAKTDNLPASPAASGDIPSAGAIADAVWDEARSGHTTAGTFGLYLDAQVSTIGGGSLTTAAIADAVWDEAISDHLTAGSTGNALNASGSSGDPWSTPLPGAYGSGTAGKIIGDRLDAAVSSRATQTSVDDLPTNAELTSALATADDAVLAILGTPAGASLAADVAAVKAQTGAIEADTQDVQARLPAALVSGRIDASVGAMADNVMTAAAAAADLTTELQSGLATASALSTVAGYLDTEIAAILAAVDTEVAAIKAKTDNLPASPAATGDIPTATQNADALLGRDIGSGTGAGTSEERTVRSALRFLRNKWAISAGVLTVRKEDDSTAAWTAAVSTTAGADPVTGNDPT